jgi:pimeloyl-ACP methyl ester carboxylesterase
VHLIQVAGFAGEPSRANATGPVLVPTAEAIDAYLVEQHLAPAVVIGHSLGGTMLIYLAEHHPADIREGMIVDSLPFYATLMAGPTATADGMKPIADKIRANSAPMDPASYDQMIKSMVSAPADQAMIRAWGKASDGAVIANAIADDLTLDLRPDLPKITTKLVMLYPDYVPAGRPAGATAAMYSAAYASAPGIKLVQITNSLHFIMLDQPQQFETALDAFLAN